MCLGENGLTIVFVCFCDYSVSCRKNCILPITSTHTCTL